jgi:formamidopyrimidine-DNA glycosylase
MPELPEVETIRRQLAPVVEGARIAQAEIRDPRWSAPLRPDELADALRGRRVERLSRRGKYLVWELEGELFLVQHLRMSGAILLAPEVEPPHARVLIELRGGRRAAGAGYGRGRRAEGAGGARARRAAGSRGRGGPVATKTLITIVDQRRFGTAQLIFGLEALSAFFAARLGLEPFDERFTAEHLWRETRGRRVPIKALLLDQRRIAGVGNIYADEALFRAEVHPARAASSLTRAQCGRLREAMIEALSAGIDAKGATIDDFRHIDGVSGSFQDRFLVHRRMGEPCPRCGTEIVKLSVAGRGTYVCERCQRPPRGAGVRRAAAGMAAGARSPGAGSAGAASSLAALRRRAAPRGGRSRRPPASR